VIDNRKAEVAGYAVAAFVVVLLALKFLRHDAASADGAPISVQTPDAPRTSAGGSPRSTGSPDRLLVVDVAGEVRQPGVYRVPAGSRADAAIARAGGVTRHAERAAVNLAMPLHDGQQIVVPRRGAAPAGAVAPAGGASGTGSPPAQPVSLSTATVEQLDTLDGIGPTLAARIVQYREAHGGFRSIDELRQVSGIGDKRFAALRKAVQP
jgi:competence protein ComEA